MKGKRRNDRRRKREKSRSRWERSVEMSDGEMKGGEERIIKGKE